MLKTNSINIPQMQSELKTQANLTALKIHDPAVIRIVDSSGHAVFYGYDKQWTKLDVEGAIFCCERSDFPRFSLIVLNRLSTTNICLLLGPALHFELQSDLLMYKLAQNISGVWFYEPTAAKRFFDLVSNLCMPLAAFPPNLPLSAFADLCKRPDVVDTLYSAYRGKT